MVVVVVVLVGVGDLEGVTDGGWEGEEGLVLVHLAVGMWYPSSDQGKIP